MEHYVTLFDSLYLPQGLALHESMEQCIDDYSLWILCVDDDTYNVLKIMSLSNVSLLRLSDLETESLLAVKQNRTKGEYCWTITPFAPKFVFDADERVSRVTYIDADIWFRNNPREIFEEFDRSGKDVLITDHAYSPEYDQSNTSGKYCVQFVVFNRAGGEVVRKWWEDRCIEWCFNRAEDGKFGDQKYLDDWPYRFKEFVHVLKNKELCLAPWNAQRFPYGNAVFWHFHGLKLSIGKKQTRVLYGPYPLPLVVRKNIYDPYVSSLAKCIERLNKIGFACKNQINYTILDYLRSLYLSFKPILLFWNTNPGCKL